ncbi:MAG: S4 domain-containing protein, partial [Anaerotruncus sp.]|nr:S4 domain-containing protein [Anaerotruncus sp.]
LRLRPHGPAGPRGRRGAGEGRPVARRRQRPLRQAARPGHDPALRRAGPDGRHPRGRHRRRRRRERRARAPRPGGPLRPPVHGASALPVEAYPLGKSDEIRAALGLDVPGLVRRIREFYRTPSAPEAAMKERADKLLAARGLAPSREKAQALIMAGLVTSAGRPVREARRARRRGCGPRGRRPSCPSSAAAGSSSTRPSTASASTSRGLVGLDIGASTGGFVDCLLKRGAARVYAVDVDTKQLDWGLAKDPRVVHDREERPASSGPRTSPRRPDIVTMDVSFISVLKILPALAALPGRLDARLPRQAPVRGRAEGRRQEGRRPRPGRPRRGPRRGSSTGPGRSASGSPGLIRCSTRGQKGNVEFFARWVKGEPDLNAELVPAWIKEAVSHD